MASAVPPTNIRTSTVSTEKRKRNIDDDETAQPQKRPKRLSQPRNDEGRNEVPPREQAKTGTKHRYRRAPTSSPDAQAPCRMTTWIQWAGSWLRRPWRSSGEKARKRPRRIRTMQLNDKFVSLINERIRDFNLEKRLRAAVEEEQANLDRFVGALQSWQDEALALRQSEDLTDEDSRRLALLEARYDKAERAIVNATADGDRVEARLARHNRALKREEGRLLYELEGGLMEARMLRRRELSFDGEVDGATPRSDPNDGSNTKSPGQAKTDLSSVEFERYDALKERIRALQEYTYALSDFEERRDEDAEAAFHYAVEDGELKDTESTYAAFLFQRARDRTRRLINAENLLRNANRRAQAAGLKEYPDQEYDFPDHASDGYSDYVQAAEVGSVDVDRIERWRAELVKDARMTALAQHERHVIDLDEWKWSPVQSWDSITSVAEGRRRELIQQCQPKGPRATRYALRNGEPSGFRRQTPVLFSQ